MGNFATLSSVAFLRPQFGVFATDGDFATRVGTFYPGWQFCYQNGHFATSAFAGFGHFATFRKSQVGFENPPFLSAIIDSR